MTTALSEREVQIIFDQLKTLNEKVDKIHSFAQQAASENVTALNEVKRLDKQHRDLHDDVFGDNGISSRVRRAEHTLVRHSVVIAIISALALTATVAGVNRILGVKGREAAAAIVR